MISARTYAIGRGVDIVSGAFNVILKFVDVSSVASEIERLIIYTHKRSCMLIPDIRLDESSIDNVVVIPNNEQNKKENATKYK